MLSFGASLRLVYITRQLRIYLKHIIDLTKLIRFHALQTLPISLPAFRFSLVSNAPREIGKNFCSISPLQKCLNYAIIFSTVKKEKIWKLKKIKWEPCR